MQRIVYAAAETRSFARAAVVLRQVGGNAVSPKTIQRITHRIGDELAQRRDAEGNEAVESLACPPEAPPELAVVQCDGGRIRTRCENGGPGVHEEQWRETKNACLLRMTHATFAEDRIPNCLGHSAIREKWLIWPKKSLCRCRRPKSWKPPRPTHGVRSGWLGLASAAWLTRMSSATNGESGAATTILRGLPGVLGRRPSVELVDSKANFQEFTPILDFTMC